MFRSFAGLAGLALLLSLFGACNDPLQVGGDLLEIDELDLEFFDTISIRAEVLRDDSLPVYQPGRFLSTYYVGALRDPVFGLTSAELATQISLGSGNLPDFDEVTVDSLVLVLPIATDQLYGSAEDAYTVEVTRLAEAIDATQSYVAESPVPDEGPVLGSQTLRPNNLPDSLDLLVYNGSTTGSDSRQPVSLRIQLPELVDVIAGLDTTLFDNDTLFTEALRGLKLRTRGDGNGLLGLQVLPTSPTSGLYLYYRRDTILQQYRFPFNSRAAKVPTYLNDYTGAPVETFLDDADAADSLVFLQGLSGVVTNIDLPGLANLGSDLLVNRAELDVFVAELPEDADGPDLAIPEQLIVLERDDAADEITATRDLVLALAQGDIPALHGGTFVPGDDGAPGFYRFTLTAQVNAILAGERDTALRLTVENKSTTVERVVLYGPGHSQYPMRLRLSVTRF